MIVTSRGISTPEQTDDYNLITDLSTMAESIDLALDEAANSYRGTTAQRTAFTDDAPEGSLWSDTNGQKILWIKQGNQWLKVWPIEDSGWIPITPNSGFSALEGLAYRKIGNEVRLRGGVRRDAGNFPPEDTSIFTLPSGFRITYYTRFPLAGFNSSGDARGLFSIVHPNGEFRIGVSGASMSEARLTPISYWVD